MKKRKVFALLLAFVMVVSFSSCNVQPTDPSDSTPSDLTLKEEKYYYDNGLVKKEVYSYANGQPCRISEYSESGVLTSLVEYFEDGKVYKEYDIDESGKITKHNEYVRHIHPHLPDYCQYGLIAVATYDEVGRIKKVEFQNRGTTLYYNTDFVHTVAYTEYEYPDDATVKISYRDENGSLDRYTGIETYRGKDLIKREFDDGRTIEYIESTFIKYQYSNDIEPPHEELTYDEQNRLIKEAFNYQDRDHVITYEYGEDGTLSKKTWYTGASVIVFTFEKGVLQFFESFIDGRVSLKEEFHANGKLKRLISFDTDGNEIKEYYKEYYENGTQKIPKKCWKYPE